MATTSSGATFSGIVGPGQSQTVLSGGNVNSATVSGTSATMTVSSGASFYNTTIAAGGTVTLYAGNGNASSSAAGSNTISSGGTLIVGSGGNTSSDTILSGGIVNFTSGSYDTYGGETVSYGGRVIFGSGAHLSGTAATVSSGGTVEIINGVGYGSGTLATINVLEGGVVDFDAIKYSAGNTYSGVVSGNRLAAYVNGTFTAYAFLSTSAYNGQTFSGSADAYDGGLDITICYLGGTMIRMADGREMAVEDIRIGDSVMTSTDGVETAQPVTWVGSKRQIVRAGLPDDQAGYPVRVRAGALADGVPHKDLLITADHCLFLDGRFVPVRMLVNGASIAYDRGITDYTYHHVETERHAIIWADGAQAETYLDTGNRRGFAQPGAVVTMQSRSLEWHRDAATPLCVERGFVEPIHARLAARGSADMRAVVTQTDADLHLVTDSGQTVRACRRTDDHVVFVLPDGTTAVRLRSLAARPCDVVGPFVDDRRNLGVLIGAMTLRSGARMHAIDAHLTADPAGWHGREAGPHRWTNGDAELPLGMVACGEAVLTVEVQAGGPYLASETTDVPRAVA